MHRGKWREFFRKKVYQQYANGCFPPQQTLSKGNLQKHSKYWELHSPDLLTPLYIEGPATNKQVNQRPPVQINQFPSSYAS